MTRSEASGAPGPRRGRRALRSVMRLAVSAGLLAVVAWQLDVGAVAGRLADLRPSWVAVALALTVVQVLVSAWRWRFTADRLGIRLPFGAAVGEYYLATFLNQVLPGGVVGDVSRAWRHATAAPGRAKAGLLRSAAVHAVVVERLSGQVVMSAVALASVAVLLPAFRIPGAAAGVAVGAVGLWMGRRRSSSGGEADGAEPGGLGESIRRSLLARGALAPQLVSSLVVVGSYVACYLAAARAVGVDTPAAVLAPLVAPVLVTMLLPVSVAGWGVREAAAGALWGAVGLTATDGVAISVAYGLLVLVSSVPGALVLLAGRSPGSQAPGSPPRGSVSAGSTSPGAAPRSSTSKSRSVPSA